MGLPSCLVAMRFHHHRSHHQMPRQPLISLVVDLRHYLVILYLQPSRFFGHDFQCRNDKESTTRGEAENSRERRETVTREKEKHGRKRRKEKGERWL
ncbi:hypothetical protein L484_003627 [Morus notabilis]|uniref:Uncharacterized protein n=1 Tax=Morus notabilis TaxID=981085 RepID=W9RE07_9ROSA|nr:hypothetical protein L484_003627 [Morus notabilis]